MPDPASEQGEHIFTLWRWAWVAALITGGITWALMFWAMWRYHRKDGDPEVPVQTRYNLPLEIFYTIAPVVMVIVFFVHTVDTQNAVLDDEGEPDHTIYVVGQQWQWTFNYVDEPAVDSPNLWEAGTASYIPTLVLPRGGDHRVPAPLTRRDPRLRRARLPDEDGRHPRPRQPLPHHAHRDR